MLTLMGSDFELTHAGAGHSKQRLFEELRPFLEQLVDRRIIFMHRDPRDTVISGYFQATKRLNIFSGDLSAFIRHQRFGIEKVIQFNLLWIRQANRFPSFVPVQYEKLHKDTHAELARVVYWAEGETPSNETLDHVVDAGRFEKMRALEVSGAGRELFGKALEPGDPNDPDSFKTRQGTVGGSRHYFCNSDIDFCGDIMHSYQYTDTMERYLTEFGS